MKNIFVLLFIVCFELSFSQNIKLYSKPIPNGFEVFIDNYEYCPVSVKIDFTLKNLKSSEKNNKVYVIPENTRGFKITNLNSIKKGRYSYSTNLVYNYGDEFLEAFNDKFVYRLPFDRGKSIKVSQGYNGTFSHQGESSIDFDMPIGTKVFAARSGIVVKVEDNNNKGCAEESCKKYNNSILIYHDDGTFADYAHIKYKGAKVKVGDKVEKGSFIAESGNVGWSTAPHLHFSVFKQKIKKRETLKTKFKVGSKEIYLKEKEIYLNN